MWRRLSSSELAVERSSSFGDNVPRDRIIDTGRCGRYLVAESSVQERPSGSSTTAVAAV